MKEARTIANQAKVHTSYQSAEQQKKISGSASFYKPSFAMAEGRKQSHGVLGTTASMESPTFHFHFTVELQPMFLLAPVSVLAQISALAFVSEYYSILSRYQ
jgi:hypothetical protein